MPEPPAPPQTKEPERCSNPAVNEEDKSKEDKKKEDDCRKAADDERIEEAGKIRDAKNEALKRWVDKKDKPDEKSDGKTASSSSAGDNKSKVDSDKKKGEAEDKAKKEAEEKAKKD